MSIESIRAVALLACLIFGVFNLYCGNKYTGGIYLFTAGLALQTILEGI